MQTYFLSKSRPEGGPLSKILALSSVALAMVMASASAQTLARPGWAGSGLAAEPWWRNAVLYRIAPASFQDSDGDGIGDLRGVANRMDYLQALGVDAVVLDPPAVSKDIDAQFEYLISAASQHHVRVVMTLEDGGNSQALPDTTVVALARMWLTRGAAGVLLRSGQSAEAAAALVHRLRALTDSFPGDRVLLAATATNPAPGNLGAITLGAPQPTSKATAGRQTAGAQLTEVPLELTNATARTIRAALNGLNSAGGPCAARPGGYFLSEELFSTKALLDPANIASLDGRRRAFALALLASRGAASLHYGQEIGMLPTMAPSADSAVLMQWTPSNVTHEVKAEVPPVAAKVEPAPAPAAQGSSEEYGTFRPYVPPPKPAPKLAPGEVAPAPVVDPDSLPGFTSGKLPVAPPPDEAKGINVAQQDAAPDSLLNLYRRLIQLHHDNPTLHSGTETLLDYDDLGAVVWVREPPKGSTTTTAIIAVCNLSGAPLRLSLNQELTRQHMHTGSLRNLLSTQASRLSVQSTDNLSLPPYGVFLGELYH